MEKMKGINSEHTALKCPIIDFLVHYNRQKTHKPADQVTSPSPIIIKLLCFFVDIKSASNIVFSNGDLDPWHRGGVSSKFISISILQTKINDTCFVQ